MDKFRAEVVVNRTLPQVWAAFIDHAAWPNWHGGEIEKVDPGWQVGAAIRWKAGAPSRIVAIHEHKSIALRHSLGGSLQGPEDNWSFSQSGNGTRVELIEDYSQSASYVSDSASRERQMKDTLSKFKKFVESTADTAEGERSKFTGSKTCARCNGNVHVLAHVCPRCGDQGTLVASIPQQELSLILSTQSEARALVDESMVFMQQGRFADAERVLKRAQELNPYNACAFGNMGGVQFLQNRFSQAIPWLEKALALDPTLEGIAGHLATARQKAGTQGGCAKKAAMLLFAVSSLSMLALYCLMVLLS